MNDFLLYIGTAFCLILVIEGLVYALFPDGVKKMMALALSLPDGQLRKIGMIMVCFGFFLIWVLKLLSPR